MRDTLFDTLYKRFERAGASGYEALPTEDEKGRIKIAFNILYGSVARELSQRERDVITLYYGSNYEMSQKEIAGRLNINQPNVSLYLSSALDKLDNYFFIILKANLWGLRYGTGKEDIQ